jgi:hypothetical protein
MIDVMILFQYNKKGESREHSQLHIMIELFIIFIMKR